MHRKDKFSLHENKFEHATNKVSQDTVNKAHRFPIKGQDSLGEIALVKNPDLIDKESAKSILVRSFIAEYKNYLVPDEIDAALISWRGGDKSVTKYYEDYFDEELKEFSHGKLDYWIQATIDGKLVGWATFQREKLDQNAVYMNLLVVDPKYQQMGIGEQLVKALMKLQEIPDLSAIHLLLRKKNRGGMRFYKKLGFISDPEYKRENFVDVNLLSGLTWRNPSLQNKNIVHANGNPLAKPTLFNETIDSAKEQKKQHDIYCGLKPGVFIR